jgi:hypothetical protein
VRKLDELSQNEFMRAARLSKSMSAGSVLQMWQVSRRVNSSRALGDDPTLIEGLAA